jgi:hypothetical protein
MTTPLNLIFGIPKKMPALPEGWTAIRCPSDFLKARDKSGKLYWIGKRVAYPLMVMGQAEYVDEKHPIKLPKGS